MERVTQHVVDQAWGSGAIEAHSAGTGALVGRSMDPGTEALLRAAEVSTEGFTARQIARELVSSPALVPTATRAHRGPVSSLHPRALRYTFALGDFVHLASGISDAEMPRTNDPGEWLTQITQLVAQRRGLVAPLDAAEVDVVDPVRRGPAVFEQMSHQLDAMRPGLERALGLSRSA